MGNGAVHVLKNGNRKVFQSSEEFDLTVLGDFKIPNDADGIRSDVWQMALNAVQEKHETQSSTVQPPDEVLAILAQRSTARKEKEWRKADRLRDQIETLGWLVNDTPKGSELHPLES
jgi:cysteinyl-tRNA synthetase